MTKPLLGRQGSSELAIRTSPQDQTSAAFFTSLPQLVVDRANLPKTAKHLAAYLARAGHLFERGSQAVRIVHTGEGERIERLNAHSVLLEAHKVCRPAEDKKRRGEIVREEITLPTQVAHLYLNLGEDLDLPILRGICAAPLLSDDGSINCSAGYDNGSGLWCTGLDTPPISAQPTVEDAKTA